MCARQRCTADMDEEEGSLDKAWVSLHKMTTPSRGLVLKLYRRCLRHADRLTYTDRDFYKMKVREEFKMAKEAKGKSVVQQIKHHIVLSCMFLAFFKQTKSVKKIYSDFN